MSKSTPRYKQQTYESLKVVAYQLLDWQKNNGPTFHTVKSDVAIDALDYIANAMNKWDRKCQEANRWKCSFLAIPTIRGMVTALGNKYQDKRKSIEFVRITSIYNILRLRDRGVRRLNDTLFALWLAIERYPDHKDWVSLRTVVEILGQEEMLYCISNNPLRRPYKLPWEEQDDPVTEYRIEYRRIRESRIKRRNHRTSTSMQVAIKKSDWLRKPRPDTSISNNHNNNTNPSEKTVYIDRDKKRNYSLVITEEDEEEEQILRELDNLDGIDLEEVGLGEEDALWLLSIMHKYGDDMSKQESHSKEASPDLIILSPVKRKQTILPKAP